MQRANNRKFNEARKISIDKNFSKNADGSALISVGNTQVLCTASISERVPPFIRGTGKGWLTAEYGMLPSSTHSRIDREAAKGKQKGRTHEIQRLIGRSLRSALDLEKLGEIQITIDCDVLNADGGTRTASITGGFIALEAAIKKLINQGKILKNPIKNKIAAISCGIINGQALLDLDYEEDSSADVDANFVINDEGKIIEIQSTAEEEPFSSQDLIKMLELAETEINNILQN